MPSPSVLRKTTTSNSRSPASVKRPGSSLSSTSKLPASPIALISVRPAAMASAWRKPVVREKTSTSKRGTAAPSTVTVPVMPPWSLQMYVYVPAVLKVRSTAAPPGLRVSSRGGSQFVPVEVTVCGAVAWSNSQRTVVPVVTVTSDGWNAGPGESTASITVGACAEAVLAAIPNTSSAATAARPSLDISPLPPSYTPRSPDERPCPRSSRAEWRVASKLHLCSICVAYMASFL